MFQMIFLRTLYLPVVSVPLQVLPVDEALDARLNNRWGGHEAAGQLSRNLHKEKAAAAAAAAAAQGHEQGQSARATRRTQEEKGERANKRTQTRASEQHACKKTRVDEGINS